MLEIIKTLAAFISVIAATIVVTRLYYLHKIEELHENTKVLIHENCEGEYDKGYVVGHRDGTEKERNHWLDKLPDSY
jgi:hypothetical protein